MIFRSFDLRSLVMHSVATVAVALLSASVWGADASGTVSAAQGRSLASTSPTTTCTNTTNPKSCSTGSTPTTCKDGTCPPRPEKPAAYNTGGDTPPDSTNICSSGGSVIDNLSFNHLHIAVDYRTDPNPSTGDCSSCSGGSGMVGLAHSLNLAPNARLIRTHRYRDMLIDSSFGPGVFQNFDEKLYLTVTDTGEHQIDYFSPTILNTMRFIDGPWVNPWGFSETLDGVYHALPTKFGVDLKLFDSVGAITADQALAATALLTYTNGDTRLFQIVTIAGVRVGRIIQMTDHTDAAITITYRYQPTDDLDGSPSRLWQINQVTDAHARTLTFSYGSVQQSGRWAVSRIDLPNGGHNLYGYQDGMLARVDLANGDVSTFNRAFDADSQKIVVSYDDPAAEGIHRRKKAYLTTVYTVIPDTGSIFPQSAQLVRMVVNGANEVTYLNLPHPQYTTTMLYEGGGSWSYDAYYTTNNLLEHRRQHAINWSLNSALPQSFDSLSTTLEPVYSTDSSTNAQEYREWYASTPTILTDAHGRTVTVTYDEFTRVTKRQHPDGTTELFAYNEFGEPTLEVDRLNRATTTTYDTRGNRLTRTVGQLWNAGTSTADATPDTATTTWIYAQIGAPGLSRCIAEIDARGNRTDYGYQANGQVVTITTPADVLGDPRPVTTLTYTAAGLIDTITEPAVSGTRSVQFFYDLRNRLVTTLYADTSSEVVTYGTGTDANLVIGQTDRNGNQTVRGYDLAGRKISEEIRGAANLNLALHHAEWTYLDGTEQVLTALNDGDLQAFTYDYRRRLVATQVFPTASLVQTLSSLYDQHHRLAIQIDRYGRRTFFGFDGDNRVTRMVQETVLNGLTGASSDPEAVPSLLAGVTRITTPNPPYVVSDVIFDAMSQRVISVDGNGNRQVMAYDSRGRVTATTEAVGTPEEATTRFDYDEESNRVAITDPRQTVTAFTYTGRNLMATMTEAAQTLASGSTLAATTFYTYTPTQKLLTVTDPLLRTTTNAYGVCCDRLITVTDALGFFTSFAYDFVGNRTSVTDANNLTTTTVFDGRNRPISVTNAAGETTSISYLEDATLLPSTASAGLGLGANADGSASVTTNPLGETSTEIRDSLGRTVRRIDGLGHQTTMTYDAQVEDAGVTLVAATTTDALNHTVTALNDAAGRTRVLIDPLGNRSTMGSDANGNRVTWRDANSVGMDCVFDARNRDVRCTDTAGAVTRKRYDANSNLIATTDALLKVETSEFDERNRKVSTTDKILATTSYGYDPVSNLTRLTDAQGGLTEYVYDPRNLLVREVFPVGQTGRTARYYGYDPGRRLSSRAVAAIAAVGVPPATAPGSSEVTSYFYDSANRLTTREYPDAKNDAFLYDHASRLLSASSARYGNQVTRAYDAASRLTSEALHLLSGPEAGVVLPVSFSYDVANRLTTITYPTGSPVTRDYTVRNELSHVWDGAQVVSARSYDVGGRLLQNQAGNGLTETRSYVANDNLVADIRIPGVDHFVYSYDALKRKTAEVDLEVVNQTQRFAYDDQSRLNDWKRTGALPADPAVSTQTWTLSSVGDWNQTKVDGVTQNRTHTAVHELVDLNGTMLLYDAKGNLTRDDQGQTFTWDFENRLATAGNLQQGQGDSAAYTYDALGRRMKKTITTDAVGPIVASTVPTYFVSAGAQEVVEITGDVTALNDATADSEDAGAAPFDPVTGLGARGSLLADPAALRYNFQPASTSTPDGWLAELGDASSGAGLGWSTATTGIDRDHLGRPLYDSFIPVGAATWQVPVANGTHAVVIMCGDADSRAQTNTLLVNGTMVVDPTPYDGQITNGYETGAFDGYAITVTVTDGLLSIRAGSGALDPKINFIEIAPVGSNVDAATLARVQAAAIQATHDTAKVKAKTPPMVKLNVWGTYVDELVSYTVAKPRHAPVRYYTHANSLYSIAATANAAGAVVERYSYNAYGVRTVKNSAGATLARSAVNQDRGFTGYKLDAETGLYFARARMYSAKLGRFISRNMYRQLIGRVFSVNLSKATSVRLLNNTNIGIGGTYVDGLSSYIASFAMHQMLDPSGEPDDDHPGPLGPEFWPHEVDDGGDERIPASYNFTHSPEDYLYPTPPPPYWPSPLDPNPQDPQVPSTELPCEA